MKYNLTEEDVSYLNNYSINKFERPSLTTDLVVLTVSKPQYLGKTVKKGKLKVLLVKRDHSPFKGLYSLPGGFCVPNEDVDVTAKRVLKEETNVDLSNAEISGVYGNNDRDPRGWIISNSFLCLTRIRDVVLRSDKWETQWFDVSISIDGDICNVELKSNDLILNNIIKKSNNKFDIIKSDLAFDHAIILLDNILKLKNKVSDNIKLAFNIAPNEFTMFELQNIVEELLLKELITSNFRRDIKNYVCDTNKSVSNGQFRPSKLFKKSF